MAQADVDRVQEFRKCIECFLCQDVCHVLRDHHLHEEFIGPRFLVYAAALEMHPLDTEDRVAELRQAHGIGYCNITKCCTKVCPEHITITDNAIIPLKERVVDEFYDPLGRLLEGVQPEGGGRDRTVTSSSGSRSDGIPAALAEGGALPDHQRPVVRREHLPRRAARWTRANQEALVTLLLAITDQFAEAPAEGARRAQELLPRLDDEYKRMYYAGIICERGAKAHLRRGRDRVGRAGVPLVPRGDELVREGGGAAAGGKRRSRFSAGTPARGSWRATSTSGRGSRSP